VTGTDCILSIWTITCDPIDAPGKFVTRRHAITADGAVATADHTIADTLGSARNAVPVGSVNIGREPADDPVILESWI
jgi:hypothetical protein